MTNLLYELLLEAAEKRPAAEALRHKQKTQNYDEFAGTVCSAARGLTKLGLGRQERVAIYLPKRHETVAAFFATSMAGGTIVPVNPLLKAEQVAHILRDCNARILVTSPERLDSLREVIPSCRDLHTVIVVGDENANQLNTLPVDTLPWNSVVELTTSKRHHRCIDTDMAAILYTSGSTGKPKGVVLSHKNMVTGARSVAQYLENRPEDRLLAVLPFSFDYGFSQLTTAFSVGACVVLMDYLLPRDVIKMVEKEQITGLAAVPPLWIQLAQLPWSEPSTLNLRYITNSGGAMPQTTLDNLRRALPTTDVFLMYGLTEAFRSTYLPPSELEHRPESMGKAIPNAEILVVREDGSPCKPGEPGELVHRGSLVALGYWNDPERTAQRFKPVPGQEQNLPLKEIAVWSGDTVKMDEDGYLYFVGRKDEMIKTSGYRISPTEIEEVIYATGLVDEAVALGVPHPILGQAILVVAAASEAGSPDTDRLLAECKRQLPSYMLPAQIEVRDSLPRNPNGKIDRRKLADEYHDIFEGAHV